MFTQKKKKIVTFKKKSHAKKKNNQKCRLLTPRRRPTAQGGRRRIESSLHQRVPIPRRREASKMPWFCSNSSSQNRRNTSCSTWRSWANASCHRAARNLCRQNAQRKPPPA